MASEVAADGLMKRFLPTCDQMVSILGNWISASQGRRSHNCCTSFKSGIENLVPWEFWVNSESLWEKGAARAIGWRAELRFFFPWPLMLANQLPPWN